MNERMVIKTAKSLNREKYILDKLNKQIENLKEKESSLKKKIKYIKNNIYIYYFWNKNVRKL